MPTTVIAICYYYPMKNIIILSFIIISLGFASVTANISVYFSPHDKCDEVLIKELLTAKQEVNIAIYSLTKTNRYE